MRSHGGGRVMRVGRVMARLESVAALLGEMLASGPRLASKRKSGNGAPSAGHGRPASPGGMTQRDQRPRRHLSIVALLAVLAVLMASAGGASSAAAAPTSSTTYKELYRPQFHFTPAKNWMNDPNGLLWYKGEYHLFFQYNPSGNTWGNISWGHAVSRDLVHWQELPLAIPADDKEFVFSGSAVIDKDNTSGFGTRENPAMVAIYTSASKVCCHQAQALAYSTDRGRTWTKYPGNPVLDLGLADFRDPKVFWYEPAKRWLMVVALSAERKVSFYSSANLKTWTHLSDFGPANAVGGVWECPDLFPLAVDGNSKNVKWVLVVNLNPGGIAGGSGAQYFVGNFDGTSFHGDNVLGSYTPPAGTVLQDFEGSSYAPWTTTGTAFGSGPAPGALPGQGPVTGFLGHGLANSFVGGDASMGKLTSPAFTISSPYINFLVGGGNHPYPGDAGNPPTAVNLVVNGQVVRTATGQNAELLNWSAWNVSALKGQTAHIETVDQNTGGFGHINADEIVFSDQAALPISTETAVNLVVGGNVVRTATGQNSENLDWTAWNVKDLVGQQAQIQIVDDNTDGWGHLLADQFMFAGAPALSVLQRSSWVDYGRDFYAVNSWNDVPDGRRIAIAWMNNWDYGGSIPTAPWRSAMSVPREFALRTIDGRPQLVSDPIGQLSELRAGPVYELDQRTITPGTVTLSGKGASGKALDIQVDFNKATAHRFGLMVRAGGNEQTVIGYDVDNGQLFVDRTKSGNVSFDPTFPSVEQAPLALRNGKLSLHILVDWSSVEVFTKDGQRVITDQIFPGDSSHAAKLFAEGGSVQVNGLLIQHMRSAWDSSSAPGE